MTSNGIQPSSPPAPQAPEAPWPPTLVEWALATLPPELEAPLHEASLALRRRWEEARLAGLARSAPVERVQALVLLFRRSWHPDLSDQARSVTSTLLAALDFDQAVELAHLALESAQLRLAEQEDVDLACRARVLLQEREQVLEVRRCLEERSAALPGAAGKPALGRRLARAARRLHDQADEATVLRRLEGFLGRRVWAGISRLTFFCLLTLLGLLVIDLSLDVGAWLTPLLWADTAICLVFLVEFLLRFSCAPRRLVWFRRHFLTDFLPALPFGLLHLGAAAEGSRAGGGAELMVRAVRLFRIPLYARYIRVLKPAVGFFRILVFGVRGMDRIVQGMAPILNRQIVFFEHATREAPQAPLPEENPERKILEEFERLGPEMRREAAPGLFERLERQVEAILTGEAGPAPGLGFSTVQERQGLGREIRAEEALQALQDLTPEQAERRLSPATLRGVGRFLSLLNLPLLRNLPLLGDLARSTRRATTAARVAHAGQVLGNFGRKILAAITAWADLSGIVTPTQILDRIASALIRSTQRPAVRLLLFGGLFLLVKLFFEVLLAIDLEQYGAGRFLSRFVATPLLVLGGACLILLMMARWLKRIAGEAVERMTRFAEERFSNLTELQRGQDQAQDTEELAARLASGGPEAAARLAHNIAGALQELRSGTEGGDIETRDPRVRRIALLMLDLQDAGFLHRSDTKGVEQFLSHPDLWNLRHRNLALPDREEKRLRALDLESGGLFSGPCLWFDLATSALAVGVARLCGTYNLYLLNRKQWETATQAERRGHQALLAGEDGLRVEPGRGIHFKGAFFNALHFLSPAPIWLDEVRREYGQDVVQRVLTDRRRLIRELFGTRALNRLPRDQRSFNPLILYQEHLGAGRFLLIPLRLIGLLLRLLVLVVKLAARSAREVLDPRYRRLDLVDRMAPFEVARRKLRMMKKPLLLEAIQLTARVDPAYLGLLPAPYEGPGHWQGDLELACPTPPEVGKLVELRERVARRMLHLPGFLEAWEARPAVGSPGWERLAAAFAMDEMGIAALGAAEERADAWLEWAGLAEEEEPPGALIREPGVRPARRAARKGLNRLLSARAVRRPLRGRLRRAFGSDLGDLRLICEAFGLAGEVGPSQAARRFAQGLLGDTEDFLVRRETLRALLGLAVIDLKRHEELLFTLGGYEEEPRPDHAAGTRKGTEPA